MGVSDLFEISKQGMDANRSALQTTANNVANANTPGHSRQQVRMTSQPSEQSGSRRTGGVQVKEVVRVHDEFVEKQLLTESKTLSAHQARRDMLGLVENAVHNEGFKIQDSITDFFNSARELSASPESKTLRAGVVSSAQNVAASFCGVTDSLNNIQGQIDHRIEAHVHEINQMAHQVADLNGNIAQRAAAGDVPLELLDQRDQLARDLARKIDFQSPIDDGQNLNVHVAGVGILVQGNQVNELTVHRTPEREGKGDNLVDIFVKEPSGERLVTHGIKGGEMGGLLDVRDNTIRRTLQGLDDAAYRFSHAVNDVHSLGEGVDGVPARPLFQPLDSTKRAAQHLKIGDELKANPDLLAVGLSAEGPSDNRIALALSDIQNSPIFSPGAFLENKVTGSDSAKGMDRATMGEFLTGLVGNIAIETKQADADARHFEAVVDHLDNYRKSVSGVNLEEEAVQMMQYQTVFNASAKALKVGDELLQTILSLKT